MDAVEIKGKTITREDVLKAMAEFDEGERDSYRFWRTYVVQHDGNEYPPKVILRKALGSTKSLHGGEPTNKVFRQLGFEIGVTSEDLEEYEEEIEEAIESVLTLERDLENSIKANLDQLEPGLSLYQSDGISGQQVHAGDAGRIDLLARDKKGTPVVIELKAGEADREVLGQIQAYMGWAQETLKPKETVRGIIVASDFTPKAIYAAKVVPQLALRTYRVSFSFTEVG